MRNFGSSTITDCHHLECNLLFEWHMMMFDVVNNKQ